MTEQIVFLPVESIRPDPTQHRKFFDEDKLRELAATIPTPEDLQQPIQVRPLADGNYQLIAGERRWRAHRIAGHALIKSLVKQIDDTQARVIQLVENLQQAGINPMEKATGYKQLLDENAGWTPQEVARAVGKSNTDICYHLALFELHPNIQALVRCGQLSVRDGWQIACATRPCERPYEEQFKVIRAVEKGQKVDDVVKAIRMQQNADAQMLMFAVEAPPEKLRHAKEAMLGRLEKLEKLFADTWDERAAALTVSAFTGSSLDKVLERLGLIKQHISRMERDLQAERARRKVYRPKRKAA